MSLTIVDHFRQTFSDTFRDTVQQKQSRMRDLAVVKTGLTGVAQQINHVMPIDMEETTGQRYKDTALRDLETAMRWYHPRDFQAATGESRWDPKGLAPTVMPGGKHVQAHVAAYNRKVDQVFLDGLFGVSYQGKTGSTQQAITQTVATDYVPLGASQVDAGLTIGKIVEAIRILKAAEAWNEDVMAMGIKLCGVINSYNETRLLQLANASSSDRLFSKDYGPPVLDDNGNLKTWLGVTWKRIETLPTATVSNDSITKLAIFTSDAVELGFWEDITTTIDRLPSKSNATQFLSQAQIGSGRTEEEKVVQINCLNPS